MRNHGTPPQPTTAAEVTAVLAHGLRHSRRDGTVRGWHVGARLAGDGVVLSAVFHIVVFVVQALVSVHDLGIWQTLILLSAGISILTLIVVGRLVRRSVIEGRRQRRMAAFTRRHGWTFQKEDATLATRVPPTLLSGFDGTFREVVAGQAGGRPFRSFIHSDPTEPKYDWVVLLGGVPASIPPIACYPRWLRDKLVRFKTGDIAFDRLFCLTGPDLLLRRVFGEPMRALMLHIDARFDGAFSWQIEAGVLATRRSCVLHTDDDLTDDDLTDGDLHTDSVLHTDMEELERVLDSLLMIAEVIVDVTQPASDELGQRDQLHTGT